MVVTKVENKQYSGRNITILQVSNSFHYNNYN